MPTYFIHLITSFGVISTLFRIISTLFGTLSTCFRVILRTDLIYGKPLSLRRCCSLAVRSTLRSVGLVWLGVCFPAASVRRRSRRSRCGSPFGCVMTVFCFEKMLSGSIFRSKNAVQGCSALYVKMNLNFLTFYLNNNISEFVLLINLA